MTNIADYYTRVMKIDIVLVNNSYKVRKKGE